MNQAAILKIDAIPKFHRGDGVETTPMVGVHCAPETTFTSGLTSFPPGRKAPMHSHNCGEHVVILEGESEVEVNGQRTPLSKHDSAYIEAGTPHCYHNVGTTPLLILWIYGATHVTRTFTEVGVTVEHLSSGDTVRPPK